MLNLFYGMWNLIWRNKNLHIKSWNVINFCFKIFVNWKINDLLCEKLSGEISSLLIFFFLPNLQNQEKKIIIAYHSKNNNYVDSFFKDNFVCVYI